MFHIPGIYTMPGIFGPVSFSFTYRTPKNLRMSEDLYNIYVGLLKYRAKISSVSRLAEDVIEIRLKHRKEERNFYLYEQDS